MAIDSDAKPPSTPATRQPRFYGGASAGDKFTTSGTGGTIKPTYSTRNMKCYTVTESELHQLSLANSLMALFFSIGSAALVFALDLGKDLILSPDAPKDAETTANMLQTGAIGITIAFFVAGVIAYLWRRGMVAMIKRESGDGK